LKEFLAKLMSTSNTKSKLITIKQLNNLSKEISVNNTRQAKPLATGSSKVAKLRQSKISVQRNRDF